VLGLEGLQEDPAFASNADRVANRSELHELLGGRFKLRTAAEWEVLLSTETIPCSPIYSVAEFANAPQLQALEMLVEMPHPDIPDLRVVDIPLTFNGKRVIHRLPPPRLGEQTTEVLEELGLQRDEIANLVRDGVVSI
jgi:crotonobetainyl-CoA:carnitine CoA-transferase CaiB-like acyl-CoA transferase